MPAQLLPAAADHNNLPLIIMTNKDSTTAPPFPPPTTARRLEGKVAIVTGGARGIGEATVRLFARHGAKVVIADVEDVLGRALEASFMQSAAAGGLHHHVTYVHCDVSCEADVEELVQSTISRLGRLDIMFNNAGVLGSQAHHKKSIVNFDADEFDRIMRVNVRGVALGMKHAARVMIPPGGWGGCIISTASVAGVMGGMGPHSYTASKHAIVGLTKNAACELGKYGIRVNCISPFGVATPMLINAWRQNYSNNINEELGDQGAAAEEEEDGRPGRDHELNIKAVEKAEEMVRGMANLKAGATLRSVDIAEAALYLASDESKYVSGHNLVVDGGITTSCNCIGL